MKKHFYGSNFYLLENAYLENLLTKLCLAKTKQPEINRIVERLYLGLIESAVNTCFDTVPASFKTRMSDLHPDSLLETQTFNEKIKAISVNLARAGTFPSHLCYDFLHQVLTPENIRQDHIFAARMTDNSHQVTGTHLGSYKIGGDKNGSYVIFPDPMGATGGTLVSAIDYYEKNISGDALGYLALHLIVTPEYLKRVLNHSPKIKVFALRLDRGLSKPEILKTLPGEKWSEERGLNDMQYIVPGAGGLGELLNNSYV